MGRKAKTNTEISTKISCALAEKKETIDDNTPLIGLKAKAIKFALDVFTFVGIKFAYVIVGDIVYFRAKDIAEFLGYANPAKAIRDLVNPKYKKTLGEILQGGSNLDPPCKINKNDLKSIYITEAGLYQLIFGSKKEEADVFRQFVFEDILPNIRKNDTYNIINNYHPTLTLDTSSVQSFYETHNITDYDEQNVVYLGVIGTCEGGYLVKYGRSSRVFKRDFEEHQVTFGKQFTMVFIMKTDNNNISENKFGNLITTKKLNRKISFNGKEKTELFVTNEFFTLDDAINTFTEIVIDNPTKKQIDEMCTRNPIAKLDKQIILAKEATKREEIAKDKVIKREEEITKQKEASLKQEEVILDQLKIKLELAKLGKKESSKEITIEPLKIVDKCIYKRFLDECTEESATHTKTTDAYEHFKIWFKFNNLHTKIPSNREFLANIKKHKIVDNVRIDKSIFYGIKNLKLIKNVMD
jgi:prophage antirepressor-like protein